MEGQHVRFMFLYDTIKARRAGRQDERVEQSRTEQADVEAKRITVLTKSQQATMDV